MRDGWVRLHRKLIDNEMFRDVNATHLFITLLMVVDRQTGSWRGGRFQLSEISGLRDSAVYRALRRLSARRMIDAQANNKFTTIYICNWMRYQGEANTPVNNKRTTSEQPANTLTRNREVRSKNTNVLNASEFDEFWDAYPSKKGKQEAQRVWNASRTRPSLDVLLAAIEAQKQSRHWREGFIPHPATWLRQGRWEDEVDTAQRRSHGMLVLRPSKSKETA